MNSVHLEEEFKYFKSHQDKLVRRYDGKVLAIKGKEVVGVYETEMDAYTDGKEKFGLGSFLIQKCLSGEEVYTHTLHSGIVAS